MTISCSELSSDKATLLRPQSAGVLYRLGAASRTVPGKFLIPKLWQSQITT